MMYVSPIEIYVLLQWHHCATLLIMFAMSPTVYGCKSFVLVRDVAWDVFDVCLTAETNGRVETLVCYSLFLELILTSQHKMHRVDVIAITLFC